MPKLRQAFVYAGWNLKALSKNPRTLLSVILAFLLCFLLTDKTVSVSREFLTDVQIFEPFIWCFSDAESVMFASLVLLLLLSELPRLDAPAAYMMFRASRGAWLLGQALTAVAICAGYTLLLLLSSMALCTGTAFWANRWSETATLLSFSPSAFEVALKVVRKTVKLTSPYVCVLNICALITLYTLMMSAVQLFLTVIKSKRAAITVLLGTNLFYFILTPERLMLWLQYGERLRYVANILSAWLSPLQHATYTMHNFGYDLLPRLGDSYGILGGLTLALLGAAFRAVRVTPVDFSGGNEHA